LPLKEKILGGGYLISDELAFKILNDQINAKESAKGMIIDGFPRNMQQM